jgi:hypothetical protein
MNLYNKHILPKQPDKEMNSDEFNQKRKRVVEKAIRNKSARDFFRVLSQCSIYTYLSITLL